ncbi:hypothetical protein CA831_31460, partial [Burkholderia multivorans]
ARIARRQLALQPFTRHRPSHRPHEIDMTALLIRNVRTGADDALDILIEGDRIARTGPSLDAPPGCAIEE